MIPLLLLFDTAEDRDRYLLGLGASAPVVHVAWSVVPGAKWRAWDGVNVSDQTLQGLIRGAARSGIVQGVSPVIYARLALRGVLPDLVASYLEADQKWYAASYAKSKYHARGERPDVVQETYYDG